jgi:hypothetical protein
MTSINAGRQLYDEHNKPIGTADTDLQSKPTTIGWGRVLYRASHGDDNAMALVRKAATDGDTTSRIVANGGGSEGPDAV